MPPEITRIVKRDGVSVEDFKFDKFVNAIMKAVIDAGGDPDDESQAEYLAAEARSYLTEFIAPVGGSATVEECQWAIFKTLVEEGHAKVAQAFQTWRTGHSVIRIVQDLIQNNLSNPYHANLIIKAIETALENHTL